MVQLLPRLRYILEVLQPPAAFAPAIAILQRIANAGRAAATAVHETPRLVPTLLGILGAAPPRRDGDVTCDVTAAARHRVRPQVLRLCKLLCLADRAIARALLAPGALEAEEEEEGLRLFQPMPG